MLILNHCGISVSEFFLKNNQPGLAYVPTRVNSEILQFYV
jgi:hypothetical protein